MSPGPLIKTSVSDAMIVVESFEKARIDIFEKECLKFRLRNDNSPLHRWNGITTRLLSFGVTNTLTANPHTRLLVPLGAPTSKAAPTTSSPGSRCKGDRIRS